MQDRFRFRVFIPDKKHSKNSLTGMFKVHSLHTGTNKAIITSDYGNCSIKLENNILMQCTGLKDKNGKLIYEGDIIKIPDDYETYGQFACEKREVYWNEGFRLKPKWDARARGNWLEDTKDFEIIGNIYENPELLED